jgi:hypothetical protein
VESRTRNSLGAIARIEGPDPAGEPASFACDANGNRATATDQLERDAPAPNPASEKGAPGGAPFLSEDLSEHGACARFSSAILTRR